MKQEDSSYVYSGDRVKGIASHYRDYKDDLDLVDMKIDFINAFNGLDKGEKTKVKEFIMDCGGDPYGIKPDDESLELIFEKMAGILNGANL